MSDDKNPFDLIQELSRALYGDHATRNQGLLDKMDSLMKGLDILNNRLDRMENKKPNVPSWTMGYIAFIAGGIFAIVAVFNMMPRTTILNIPPELAAFFAVGLAAIALYFFLIGFGWIGRD